MKLASSGSNPRVAAPLQRRAIAAGLGALCIVGWALPGAVHAQATRDTGQGEVTKLDRDPPRLTIRHGELRALDMPAMTMAYRLQSPSLAEGIKPGDRVRFQVEKINGQYVLTRVEPIR